MSRTAASSRTALIPSLQTDVRIWNVMSDSAAPTIETRNDTTFALLVIFLASKPGDSLVSVARAYFTFARIGLVFDAHLPWALIRP